MIHYYGIIYANLEWHGEMYGSTRRRRVVCDGLRYVQAEGPFVIDFRAVLHVHMVLRTVVVL